MPNWAKNGSPVSGAPAVQSAAPAGAASKSAAAMPAAAQEIDRFKEPSPGSRIDRRYRRAGGAVKVRACDLDYRGGRTRRPRTATSDAHRIVWCGVATVDRRGRPRTRILHPIWERAGDGVRGWVVTRKSPLKTAHLERTPYLSCTYWNATHDVAIADCHAIRPDGPSAEGAALLALEPWR